jgi:hypothetical protein
MWQKYIFLKNLSWEDFKIALHVEEPIRAMGSLQYSWDNQRNGV